MAESLRVIESIACQLAYNTNQDPDIIPGPVLKVAHATICKQAGENKTGILATTIRPQSEPPVKPRQTKPRGSWG